MLRPRVIPCLLLRGRGLVKTRRFKDPVYVGDPINAIKIFNEKEVDELVLLDIMATREGRRPPFDLIEEAASECFMPLGYGGGVRTMDDLDTLFRLGVEKVVINAHALETPHFLKEASDRFGSQSIVVSIDVRKTWLGGYKVFSHGGSQNRGQEPVAWAREVAAAGAGEIFLNSIDRDGTMEGYDLALLRRVTDAVEVPVIAAGGAGGVADLARALHEGHAAAVAAGAMMVFQGPHRAVLISYPTPAQLAALAVAPS